MTRYVTWKISIHLKRRGDGEGNQGSDYRSHNGPLYKSLEWGLNDLLFESSTPALYKHKVREVEVDYMSCQTLRDEPL